MKNKTVIILAMLVAIGCNKNEIETTDDSEGIILEVPGTAMVSNYAEHREKNGYPKSSLTGKKETVVLYLDKMSFGEAFSIQHRAKGEGHTFWWRSNQYTTDLKKEDR